MSPQKRSWSYIKTKLFRQLGNHCLCITQNDSSWNKLFPAIERNPFNIFCQYVFGRKFRIENDDKTLKTILTKPIREAPPQMQRSTLTKPNQFVRSLHIFSVLCWPNRNMTLTLIMLQENISRVLTELNLFWQDYILNPTPKCEMFAKLW